MNKSLDTGRRNNGMTPYNSLQHAINRLFQDFWNPMDSAFFKDLDVRSHFIPSCDIEETSDGYMYTLDVPGMRKEDIKIEVANNTLTISGERKSEHKDETRKYTERSHGQFQRTMTLPSAVNAEKVEATYEDGVLKIAVPKDEGAKPRQIPVGSSRKSPGTRPATKEDSTNITIN